ncbi:hypothetical protein L228DRAFT_250991 [Xylona heveae TC161]|uniref:DDHD domain-containing protein n=1 Tax=Xylona heveae (strain CBS 132557 / TC161) TaxID=1328760 RepID=A0A164ZQW4_XYLHT|nr:hypothetical protein L228DRAFT_250991 [Xylona heveae TC161]KZF19394.1 hypothetical protein L228DRAFT_250991 [Xylona heveae TC161]
MATHQHTYGPSCLLSGPTHQAAKGSFGSPESPPAVRAQFFYTSPLPIDDPLSPVPSPSGTSTATYAPRPYSAYDNKALEEKWAELLQNSQNEPGPSRRDTASRGGRRRSSLLSNPPSRPGAEGRIYEGASRPGSSQNQGTQVPNAFQDFAVEAPDSGYRRASLPQPERRENAMAIKGKGRQSLDGNGMAQSAPNSVQENALDTSIPPPELIHAANLLEKDTTGTPFLRAPSRNEIPRYIPPGGRKASRSINNDGHFTQFAPTSQFDLSGHSRSQSLPNRPRSQSKSESEKAEQAHVLVGVSRLHVVVMPEFKMKPIYWSPVHDVSSVIRGTWFYRDMTPVEPEVANQLEAGYIELKPWTETWNDELNSALEVGPEGEAKIVHRLWPRDETAPSRPGTAGSETRHGPSSDASNILQSSSADAPDSLLAIAGQGEHETEKPGPKPEATKLYPNSSVIYANARQAFILRPSQLPSAYYGRKPLNTIRRKGSSVGIPVLRGFDWASWEKYHPSKSKARTTRAYEGAAQTHAEGATPQNLCAACLALERRPPVTDLVLVIHGIGQKLSERVESFHFTHAINAFRREVNVELGTDDPATHHHLRQEMGGIMLLPVNWRSTVSFEDEEPGQTMEESAIDNEFSLKDITPETIPAVRNLISDVMLDIPYYLSHHKSKMIEAVVKEANRVYRLWCKNNPGFEQTGRVHIIAHSLGSAMCLDILSRQPTSVPSAARTPQSLTPSSRHFEFDTKNLFFCGSPAGFFLLLNKAKLLPRKGRNKPGADGEDIGRGIAGEAGTFGCLAIDNIYNVLNYNDPIAYRLNATVDVDYSDSLRPGVVPSARAGWMSSLGSVFKGVNPGSAAAAAAGTKPPMARFPSTIEMETHNFSREEIAEKKFLLLNDNRQIDYYLRYGGGPLEIQYLNMLGAHSSYWVSRDFVRFLVMEIGRAPGQENTIPSMRAIKKTFRQ